jgi:hypothetical protein
MRKRELDSVTKQSLNFGIPVLFTEVEFKTEPQA